MESTTQLRRRDTTAWVRPMLLIPAKSQADLKRARYLLRHEPGTRASRLARYRLHRSMCNSHIGATVPRSLPREYGNLLPRAPCQTRSYASVGLSPARRLRGFQCTEFGRHLVAEREATLMCDGRRQTRAGIGAETVNHASVLSPSSHLRKSPRVRTLKPGAHEGTGSKSGCFWAPKVPWAVGQ